VAPISASVFRCRCVRDRCYFSAIVAAGLATAIFLPRERHASVVALIMLGCYVAFQGGLHIRAVNEGKAHAAALGFVQAEVHALPQPLSPFNWKIIVSNDDGYNEALVNLLRSRTRMPPGRKRNPSKNLRGVSASFACRLGESLTLRRNTFRDGAGTRGVERHRVCGFSSLRDVFPLSIESV
jgi:hypothetical protein